ncbi:dual specificity protein phosphatase 12-like isoform X2 [Gigantopelta aegis]|uniref:dual specificity protein phosphatase 12-like isoform X2 n=1 Tax=Gigantopelta aegis TaxID=1735272 RepID=UPI001B88A1A1|nr:dual specificity protein phosphatase 12-like isoform X2 [Gigantopelta aegis]
MLISLVGASRSATMVIAYTMSKNKMQQEEAVNLVKQKRPIVKVNCGFQEQLKLYEDMGCCVDKTSSIFRQYKLGKLAARVQAGVYKGPLLDELMSEDTKGDTVFKCKKCRLALFKDGALLHHKTGQGESAFDWRGKMAANEKIANETEKKETCKKSLFIEPVKWMKHCTETMDGKLSCPKCSAKIGSFIWYGERCPCGSWVAPAFHIQSSKVDECRRNSTVTVPAAVNSRNTVLPVMTEAGPSGSVLLVDSELT